MYGIETIRKLNESAVRASLNDNSKAKETGLPDNEVQEIRQIIANIREAKEQTAQTEYHEKLSSLRSQARWILKSLLDKCRALKEYRNAEYVGHRHGNTILRLPDGKGIGFGFAGHMSGAAAYFYETFKFWGFEGPRELYLLPKHLTDEFFDKGIVFVEALYGKDAEGLERLMNVVDKEEDPAQLTLLRLMAEDLTTETMVGLSAIAQSVKAKAEAEERRSVQVRIRKRLGVVQFYLEEHL